MPDLSLRGWTIDAARLPEPLPYYRRLIDFCADWGFNTILIRLADDQGSAFRFASHPELVTHPHAYTAEELADLAAYAAGRGIMLIPEIESFGHTGYITRASTHASLLDVDPRSGSSFTGIIPTHADSLALLADLYREVAAAFPGPYLHAGCDEVNWGGSEYSRARIAARGRAAVWAEHIDALNQLARGLGKELMIWGDHALNPVAGAEEPGAILAGLDRSIILVDWNYWDSEPSRALGWDARPGPIQANARRALEAGFRVVGAPAWCWCRWGMRAGQGQLRNIDAFADIYRAIADPRALGVIVTNWVPSRYLQGAAWDAPAYAGTALSQGSASARLRAFPRFVQERYGVAWDARWADFFRGLYEIIPARRSCSAAWTVPFQPPLWGGEEELAALLAQVDLPYDFYLPFPRLRADLDRLGAAARQNGADLQTLGLALEFLEHLHFRCLAALRAGQEPSRAGEILAGLAQADAQMAERLEQDWDQSRFPDDPAKTSLLADLSPEDQPLASMRRAAQFSAALAADPRRFFPVP